MELIEVILSKENLNRAYKKVVANKGASGVDGVTVEELGDYIRENKDVIVTSIRRTERKSLHLLETEHIYRNQSEEYTFRKTMVRKDHWEYPQHLTELSSRQ